MTSLFKRQRLPLLTCAATLGMFAAAGLALVPEPASACGNGYGANYRNCSGRSGGSYSYSGGGGGGYVDYGGAASAAIGILGIVGPMLGEIANGVGEMGANANLGPTQQEIYDNIAPAETPSSPDINIPNPFNLFGNQPNAGVQEPQQTAEDKTPPGCTPSLFGSFQQQGVSAYNEALEVRNSAKSGFAYTDPDTYRDAAKKARDAAENFRCSKNAKNKALAERLARDLNNLAERRAKKNRQNTIDTANRFQFHILHRPEVNQIKAEIQDMKSKGYSNRKIKQTLKSKGYTNEDIQTAVTELNEAG